jgi:hypothetical protein
VNVLKYPILFSSCVVSSFVSATIAGVVVREEFVRIKSTL